MSEPRKRSWWPIVAGVLLAVAVAAAGAIVATTAYVRENLRVEHVEAEAVARAFDEARAQFGERPPLMRIVNRVPQVDTGRAAAGKPSTTRLATLHVLAYDPRDNRLVRFQVPFWLLRLKAVPIKLGAYVGGSVDGVSLDVETIDRNGPGIVLDMEESGGDRVLIWAE